MGKNYKAIKFHLIFQSEFLGLVGKGLTAMQEGPGSNPTEGKNFFFLFLNWKNLLFLLNLFILTCLFHFCMSSGHSERLRKQVVKSNHLPSFCNFSQQNKSSHVFLSQK